MRTPLLLLGLALAVAGCATPSSEPSAEPSTAPPATAFPNASSSPSAETLQIDQLAEVLVDSLRLRASPRTQAESFGLLPRGEPAYVVAGPVQADGHPWYQLASVREPYHGDCGDPAPSPSLACASWFGWAAGASPSGEPWLAARSTLCPAGPLDTATYIRLLAAERLACFGDRPWSLTAYIAPLEGGRGCFPLYVVKPGWLGACATIFPQPEESELDQSEALVMHVHPDLGSCSIGVSSDCPFVALKGQWVDIGGHLDDPAAASCTQVPNPGHPAFLESPLQSPFPPAADPAAVVLGCRATFVAVSVTPRPD